MEDMGMLSCATVHSHMRDGFGSSAYRYPSPSVMSSSRLVTSQPVLLPFVVVLVVHTHLLLELGSC
jgi:hypothetical protein